MASHEGRAAGGGAGGAAGGASGTKRKASAMSSDATEWPAPGDKGYGTMHETFDRHWVECAKEIERYSPFFPWWRMVKRYVLAAIDEADESSPEDQGST